MFECVLQKQIPQGPATGLNNTTTQCYLSWLKIALIHNEGVLGGVDQKPAGLNCQFRAHFY